MPLTGFAPGVITAIPARPANVYDTSSGITVDIPSLGIKTSIVGVPQSGNTWDVTWLGNDVGYLDGTAFPTWSGDSVLTGHVYLSNGLPGPFVNLHTLKWGDQIILHLADQRYIYQVREDKVVSPDDSSVIKHEDDPWLTLITCKDYNAATDSYDHRVVVRAVLVKVEAEPAPGTNSR
jgi:LPXTG-site transpeptidase (sortase) family protein